MQQSGTTPTRPSQLDRKAKLERLRQLRKELQYCQVNCKAKADEYFALNQELGPINRVDEAGVAWDLTNIFLNSVAGAGDGFRVVIGIFGGVMGGMPKPQPKGQ